MHLPYLLPFLLALPSTINAALPYKGVDWSSLLIEERAGRTYKNSAGTTQPLETILKNAGVNTVRQRLWVNPSGGNYSLDYNIQLAKRAKAAGLQVYLDMHYSDTWADPGHQATPAAWKSLGVDALVKQIYDYTKNVMDTFQSNGVSLALVSIGNEITPGLLFPTGQLSSSNGAMNAAKLLKSASQAIKESSLNPKPKIMIHIDNGWNWGTQQYWYDKVVTASGPFKSSDYDIQGISYYPFYSSSATLSSLSSSMSNMAKRYAKPIMVVETNWPTYCSNPAYTFPSDTKSIPFSVDGQKQWIQEVAKRVQGVSGGLGQGLFYWEPAWIDNAGLGSSCQWNLMVDDGGKDMGGLGVFGQI
ncbi:glycosyl hydrolase 53 [Delitschia confertaspora ATCC 74209]|uniref:Arabinogalactan endo-beta-1,4-galactanase n=1 Tax=Delitschia confertaspora ATCC 74209 TaxID=1513339 RepID=A0A9P4MKI4_9PLEO|nr:glycosyl hydrolase 53 [Delitschia confertaspora ATCC 74209]